MKICILTSSFPLNAGDPIARFAAEFAQALVGRGAAVTVVTQNRPGDWMPPDSVSVRRFAWAGGAKPAVGLRLRSPADLLATVQMLRNGRRTLDRVLREESIDHCLALWAIPSGYTAWRACRRLGIPYSVWALGADIYTWGRRTAVRPLVRSVLRGASARFADGFALAAEVTQLSGLECGFMSTSRRLPAPGSAVTLVGEDLRFLFVGRFEMVKGVDVLIEAVAALRARGIGAGLTMYGLGSMEAQLRAMVADLRLSDAVRIVNGAQPGEVLAAHLAAADCLVIPSRMESIPVVLSDALQAGTPVIVSDVGDMGDLARQYGLGEPVPPDDPHALAGAMAEFAQSPDRWRSRYETGRAALLPIFDIDESAARFLAAAR